VNFNKTKGIYMELNIGALTSGGEALLQKFTKEMGLDGALIATAEGLEMASFFNSNKEADAIAADMASLLSVMTGGLLINTQSGTLKEMIISAENGSIAIKDLGEDIALGIVAPEGYKMGGLVVSLKKFVAELQAL